MSRPPIFWVHSVFPTGVRVAVLFCALILLMASATSSATTIFWNQSGGGDFNTAGNWNTSAVPGPSDTAVFDIGMTGDVTLSADATPGSISFDTGATSFSLGTLGGNTITTGNGGAISILSTLTTAGQTFTINAPLILAPDSPTTAGGFTIQNDSPAATTILGIAGGISGGTTSSTVTLTLAGSNAGANLVSGIISDGGASALNVVKNGAGTWTLTAANGYTGGTSIAGGTLALSGGDDRLATTGTVSFTGTDSSVFDVGTTSQSLAGLNFQTTGMSSVNTITGSGGTLAVTGGNIQIGGGDSTSTSNAQTVDMSGLGTFIYNRSTGTFAVGGTTNFTSAGTTGSGTLSMAGVNTITAASFNVGYYSTGLNSVNSGTVHLGQTNTINASTIVVGNVKTFATLDFQNLVNPTLTIRGTTGTNSRASILVSTANSGITDSVGMVDLTSGGTVSSTLDAMVSTLTIGQNIRNATGLGKTSTGTFIMGLGTLDATAIILGQQTALTGANTFSGAANATLSLNGGTIIATTFTLADKRASTAAQAINSTFNLFSGTLSATTIQRGTAGTGAGVDTATINFNWVDGTIGNIANTDQTVSGNTAVNGLTGGLNIVLNNTGNVSGTHIWSVSGTQTATVENTVTLSGNGSLTKTGTGTLALMGGNSYAGITTVSQGTLIFGAAASLNNGVSSNWTTANLVVESGALAGFNVGGAGEFTVADVDLLKALGTATGGFKDGSFIGLDTTNAAGGVFTFSSVIEDTNNRQNTLGLVKMGSGTLELSGANTFTGGTSIQAGTLALSGGDDRLLNTGTLAFTGSGGTLDVGSTSQTLGGLTFLATGTGSHVITGAGGSLTLNSGNIQIGGGDATTSGSETVDMSGLSNFNYTNAAGNFYVGGLGNSTSTSISGNGVLSLAATNTITATSFKINPFFTGLSSTNTGTVHLGQTNTINATTILIGEQKTIALLDFQSGLVNPTLKIRGTGGTDTDRATITIGYNASGVLISDSTVDLITGITGSSILDAKVSTLLIGQSIRSGSPGKAVTGAFLMGMGTLDATTIILGQQNPGGGTSSSQATATLSLSGGTISVTTFTLADKQSGAAAQTITSNFNLNSGTLNATTIQRGTAGTGAGADTATINFNWVDGTIGNIEGVNQTVSGNTVVNGLTGGLNIVLNNTGNVSGTHTWNVSGALSGVQTSTIQSTAILSGAGSLTKTGLGTLILESANLYSGMTTIAEGELRLNTTGTQAIAGDVTVAGGTLRLLQADQINAASSMFVSGGTFALQGFNQTLAGVQLTGGSITSSTGILTSTSAFDLRAGSISAILGGSAGVVKSTSGVVTLSGANVFSGGTQVNAGTLIGTSTAALGSNSGVSIANGATFAYRPTTAGSLNLGSGAITLVGGSTIGSALGSALSQSVIQSSSAATASGSINVDLFIASGGSVAVGTHNLVTVSSGLTSGGASYSLHGLYNATNFTVSNLTASDTAVSINVASATALTSAYWKGGLSAGNNVWALSNGSASNWVTNSNGTGSTPLVPGVSATVNFSATGATNQSAMVLGASMSIRNLVVSDTSGITLNSDGNSLTIANSSGINVNSGAGAVTLNAPIVLGASQTWTNNSTNALSVGGAVSGGFSVTKSGTGVLNLSGANTFTGTLSITAGTVNLSGGLTSQASVASSTNSKAILNIQSGATLSGSSAAIILGAAGASGAVYQTGGEVLLNQNLNVGLNGTSVAGSYGFYQISGGVLTDTGAGTVRFRVGGGGSYSRGLIYQTGGTVLINYGNGLEVGANATGNFVDANGVAYLTGGTLTALSNRIGYNNTTSSSGGIRGEQTVDGSALVTINGSTILAQGAGDTGILNLNGGVFATKLITRGNASGLSIVNFDGGTLKAAASASGGSFMTGLTRANVLAGGLIVDTSNQTLTIGQALLAPTGNGVTTIAVTDGGSGFVGAPYVSITGDGTGATAVANMVDDGTGNGTFKIASITITSPGTDYTSTPVVTLVGGGGTGVVLGSAALAANTSGGVTKTGAGTLTLSGTNTYTGATVVDAGGTLIAGNASAFGIHSAATVNGTLRTAGRDIALGSLAGSGTVENASATASTLTTGGDGSSTTYEGTIRNGSGAGTLSFVKVGAGTQILAADNTYTGTTLISEGVLQIGQDGVGSTATASAVTVNGASATLAGSGIVAGSVTVTSGSLRPGDAGGNAMGNLTLGSLDLTTGGTAILQIEGSSSHDSIAIVQSGDITLNGKIVVTTTLTGMSLDNVFADGATFDLLDWSGVVSGTFDVGANLRDGSADAGLQFDLPDISSLARFWDVSSFLTTGSITVVVPEPSRATLLFVALLAMGARRRRTRQATF